MGLLRFFGHLRFLNQRDTAPYKVVLHIELKMKAKAAANCAHRDITRKYYTGDPLHSAYPRNVEQAATKLRAKPPIVIFVGDNDGTFRLARSG